EHEALRLRPVVLPSGKPDGPVRRHQAEAVPTVPPRLAGPSLLENSVVHAGGRQLVADGQPRRAGTDHDDVDWLHHLKAGTYLRGDEPSRKRTKGVLEIAQTRPSGGDRRRRNEARP